MYGIEKYRVETLLNKDISIAPHSQINLSNNIAYFPRSPYINIKSIHDKADYGYSVSYSLDDLSKRQTLYSVKKISETN